MLGCETGRIQSTVPNFTVQDKQAGLDKFKCICGDNGGPNRQRHTHTCNDSNWEYYHPKLTNAQVNEAVQRVVLEHRHVFYGAGAGTDYNICECGVSDVYYNHEYNKKPKNKPVSDTDGWRDDY